jgi:uncharacterized protein
MKSSADVTTPLPAGNFSDWLHAMRDALGSRGGMDVACGECRGCCVSAMYVKVRPHETDALAAIGEAQLEPGMHEGNRLLGHREDGTCRMLQQGDCSIYAHRPETCRAYDCRVFAAAGMSAGPGKPVINARVARWRFQYPTTRDQDEQRAVTAAAAYLRQHPVRFPDGHVPSRPTEIAVLAVKAYEAFLQPANDDAQIRAALIRATLDFDRRASTGDSTCAR